MYTPTRRASVSDTTHRFTPSKRGQAALDALALGYDVQLPECSFALLPRSTASEHALASFLSTPGIQQPEQYPRGTNFADAHRTNSSVSKQVSGQQQHSGSEISDRKRFSRPLHSPRGEGVLYSTTHDEPPRDISTPRSSISSLPDLSRPASSSRQSITSQYALASPHRTQQMAGSVPQEFDELSYLASHTPRISDVPSQPGHSRHHSMAQIQTSPARLARRPHKQTKADNPVSVVSPTDESGMSSKQHGYGATSARGYSARTSPLKPMAPLSEVSTLERSLETYFSPRGGDSRSGMQGSRPAAHYARNPSGAPAAHSTYSHNARRVHGTHLPGLKSPIRDQTFLPGTNYSPVYQTHQLPEDDRMPDPRFSDKSQSRRHYSTSEPATSSRRNSRSHTGSQRPQTTPSLMTSPLPPSGAALGSSRSPQSASAKPPLRVSTQSLHGPGTQPLRSAPLPSSSCTAQTPTSSSRTTPSFQDDLDDEAFKVHPERAALSRMESLLMLSACRQEAEGRKPLGNGSQGYDRAGMGGGIMGYSAADGIVTASNMDGVGYYGSQAGGFHLRSLAYPNMLGLGEPMVLGPPEAPKDFGFRASPGMSNQERSPAVRRPRQRSGSMGPSSYPDSPQRSRPFSGPPRNRQRSASVIVQGLSPEAVKKLRAYEMMKYREGRSLRAIIGCDDEDDVKVQAPKGTLKDKPPQKISGSPAQVPIPFSPAGASLPLQHKITPAASLVTEIPAPPSPCNVPLPPSPPQSPVSCLPSSSSTAPKATSPIVSSLVASDSFMKYRASQGIESPRPMRTRQNTCSGRVVPTFRLIASPEKVDHRSTLETLEASAAGDAQTTSDGGLATEEGSTQGASLRSDSLRIEPRLERILTPPPSFWSPPPLSAVVRTSAPLLPAANVQTPTQTTRATSVSLPTTRTTSAPPPRPMSVPPSTDSLHVDTSDEVRRAWSCEPASAEPHPVKSFAGDWTQCMVIELSDEEDEVESTDTDQSELEDGDQDSVSENAEEDNGHNIISELETKPNLTPRAEPRVVAANLDRFGATRAIRDEGEEPRYGTSKGGTSSSISGVNAVEAVQHAIVKLALDNAGGTHMPRASVRQGKSGNAPSQSGVTAPNNSIKRHHVVQKQSLDARIPNQASQLHALANSYFSGGGRAYRAPNLRTYPRANNHVHALESLRSGLELRAAASASAVEEAVRARSASPSIPQQDAPVTGARSAPGFVLPPRLQRLQGIQPWTPPQLPLPRLDMTALSQQPRPFQDMPLQPSPQAAGIYSQTLNLSQHPALSSPQLVGPLPRTGHVVSPNPRTLETNRASPFRHTATSEAGSKAGKSQPTRLSNIVVDKQPVPPAPTTAPLARAAPDHDRQPRRSAEAVLTTVQAEPATVSTSSPAGAPASQTPAPLVPPASDQTTKGNSPTPPSNSSPKLKNKGGKRRRYNKHRKNTSPATSKDAPSPPAPPAPPASSAPPASTSKPNAPAPQPKASPATATSTQGPKRKNKPHKKSKSTKPGASNLTG